MSTNTMRYYSPLPMDRSLKGGQGTIKIYGLSTAVSLVPEVIECATRRDEENYDK